MSRTTSTNRMSVPVSAGDIVDPDPFLTSMDGGAVPWPRIKEAL